MNETSPDTALRRVECTSSKDAAVRRFIVAGFLLFFGGWCFLDHYVWGKYPYPEPYRLNDYLSYLLNHWGPWVMLPGGLAIVTWTVLFLRRRFVADREGLGYVGKEKLAWERITRLDTSRWESKQILYLHHGAGRLKLDSLDFDKRGFHDLVAFIEAHVPAAAREDADVSSEAAEPADAGGPSEAGGSADAEE